MDGDREAPRTGPDQAAVSEPQVGSGAGGSGAGGTGASDGAGTGGTGADGLRADGSGAGGAGAGTVEVEIDAAGLLCPLPVLRAGRALRAMAPGTVLRLCATDPVAVVDVPHYCAEAGHALLSADHGADGVSVYLIRRGPD